MNIRHASLLFASILILANAANAKEVKQEPGAFAKAEKQRLETLKEVDDEALLVELQRLSVQPPDNDLQQVASASAYCREAGRRSLVAARPLLIEIGWRISKELAAPGGRLRTDFRAGFVYRLQAERMRIDLSVDGFALPEAQVKEVIRRLQKKIETHSGVINAELMLLEEICASSPSATRTEVLPVVRDKTANQQTRDFLMVALRAAPSPEVQAAIIDVVKDEANRERLFFTGLAYLAAVGDKKGLAYLQETLRKMASTDSGRKLVSDTVDVMSARLASPAP